MTRGSRATLLVPGLLGALGVVLSLLRQRGVGALDTMWAEDGTIFLQGALGNPSPALWLEGYAGYMNAAPRILGSLAAALPIGFASEVLSLGGAAVTAAVAVVTYHAAREHISTGWVRVLLALAVVLLPPAGTEGLNAAANIHWYLLYACVWVSLWRPKTRGEQAMGSGILLLTAASDPFAVMFAPVLARRLLGRREASDWVFAASLGIGLALQAGVILVSSGSRAIDPTSTGLVDLGRWYGFRVLQTAVFGVALRDRLVDGLGVVASSALALVLIGALLLPALRAAWREPWVPLVLVALHLGLYFLPAALAGMSPPRYSLAPILTLYALIAWGLVRAQRAERRWFGALAIGLFAVIAVLDFAPPNARAAGPSWSEQLASASARCELDPAPDATLIVSPLPTPDPTDPSRTSKLWSVEVSCRELVAGDER